MCDLLWPARHLGRRRLPGAPRAALRQITGCDILARPVDRVTPGPEDRQVIFRPVRHQGKANKINRDEFRYPQAQGNIAPARPVLKRYPRAQHNVRLRRGAYATAMIAKGGRQAAINRGHPDDPTTQEHLEVSPSRLCFPISHHVGRWGVGGPEFLPSNPPI